MPFSSSGRGQEDAWPSSSNLIFRIQFPVESLHIITEIFPLSETRGNICPQWMNVRVSPDESFPDLRIWCPRRTGVISPLPRPPAPDTGKLRDVPLLGRSKSHYGSWSWKLGKILQISTRKSLCNGARKLQENHRKVVPSKATSVVLWTVAQMLSMLVLKSLN